MLEQTGSCISHSRTPPPRRDARRLSFIPHDKHSIFVLDYHASRSDCGRANARALYATNAFLLSPTKDRKPTAPSPVHNAYYGGFSRVDFHNRSLEHKHWPYNTHNGQYGIFHDQIITSILSSLQAYWLERTGARSDETSWRAFLVSLSGSLWTIVQNRKDFLRSTKK